MGLQSKGSGFFLKFGPGSCQFDFIDLMFPASKLLYDGNIVKST